jgi:hypothetical protein
MGERICIDHFLPSLVFTKLMSKASDGRMASAAENTLSPETTPSSYVAVVEHTRLFNFEVFGFMPLSLQLKAQSRATLPMFADK